MCVCVCVCVSNMGNETLSRAFQHHAATKLINGAYLFILYMDVSSTTGALGSI